MKVLGVTLLLFSATCAQVIFPGENTSSDAAESDIDEQLNAGLNITNRQNFFFPSPITFAANCRTPAGERGICGSLSQCPSFIPFLNQLTNPSVTLFFRQRICRLLFRTVHICCPIGPAILPSTGGSLPPPPPSQPQPVPTSPSTMIPSEAECGLPGGVRVTGGFEVQPGFWPWLAALGLRSRGNQFFVNCGGTLITRRHVLTAAHCFGGDDEPNIVRLGEHHIDNDFAGERPEEFRIARHVSHNYNPRTNENDLALITLDRDVTFNDFIRPACLPFSFRSEEFLGESLTVVGWGRTAFENRVTSKVPMQANVPVVERNRCISSYRNLRTRPTIDQRQICAGVGGQDSCNGDSGGPLNYLDLDSSRYYVVGVVSFGVQCARADFPGVYTRVSSFIPWIQQNLQ
ncbi:hypothetical protein SK128_012282 [Halocaridina rubra]|uniref:CLIP domain-containing serine protease n=1 Tax=Halocaridina rubra TaxID=373956 RepID=A0AAN9ACC0_HALRR